MIKKRIMVIGPTGSGKTSIINAINGDKKPLKKSQDIIFGKETMDVPSAYLENPWMYRHIISAAQNSARHILVLIDQSKPVEIYPHGFAKVFGCPVTGVITKSDLNPENQNLAQKQLEKIGVNPPYVKVSTMTGEGVEQLLEKLGISRV